MIDFINRLGSGWMTYFGWAVIQNTFFLGLLFFALYLLQNTSARLKYAVTLIGLIKLLLPPFLPATFLSLPVSDTNSASAATVIQPVSEIVSSKAWFLEIRYTGWLLIIWTLFAVGSILIALSLTLRLKSRLKTAVKIDHQKLDLGNNIASIQILKSDKISIPLTMGMMPQNIYVPALWDQWSERCKRMIIQHELAHIKRKDGIAQLLQILAQAIYFFHPLVWQLSKRMNECREMACDEASIENNSGLSVEYSRALVEIAENMVQTRLGVSSASALIRQKNELLNRVQYLIREVKMHNTSKLKIGLILAGLLIFIVPLSWTKSTPAEPANSGTKSSTEETGELRGYALNEETDQGMSGVTITLKGTDKQTTSDEAGKFRIDQIKTGIYILEANHIGFKNVVFSDVKIKKEEPTWIKIKLSPVVVQTSDVSAPPSAAEDEEITFVEYDTPPMPVGGFAEIQKYLDYPEAARKAGTEGKVVLYVHISETGEVLKTKVQESVNPECDKAAIKAIQSVKWNPAKQGDDPVAVWVAVPISFKLH